MQANELYMYVIERNEGRGGGQASELDNSVLLSHLYLCVSEQMFKSLKQKLVVVNEPLTLPAKAFSLVTIKNSG